MRVEVDTNLCQGHGNCYNYQPDLFAPDEEAFAVVKVDELDGGQLARARSAMTTCPERAITVR